MTINKINLYTAKIPRKFPFRTSQSVQHSVDGVFTEIFDDDGFIGTGESAPREHITGETLSDTRQDLENISDIIMGTNPQSALEELYHMQLIGPSSKVGTEMALLDVLSQKQNLPLCDYLNKNDKQMISYCGFISGSDCGDLLTKKVEKAKKNGYEILRVKVGDLSYSLDEERIKLIREVGGENLKIWIDVNQGWEDSLITLSKINHLNKYDLFMVEQPLPITDKPGLWDLHRYSAVPIMLDESVHHREDLEEIICNNYADAVNLKFMKTGSYQETKQLVGMAHQAGLKTYCGGSAVTDIFASFARHVEFAIPELDFYSAGVPRGKTFKENPTFSNLRYSPFQPYAMRPTEIGLGVRINHEIFDKYILRGESNVKQSNYLG